MKLDKKNIVEHFSNETMNDKFHWNQFANVPHSSFSSNVNLSAHSPNKYVLSETFGHEVGLSSDFEDDLKSGIKKQVTIGKAISSPESLRSGKDVHSVRCEVVNPDINVFSPPPTADRQTLCNFDRKLFNGGEEAGLKSWDSPSSSSNFSAAVIFPKDIKSLLTPDEGRGVPSTAVEQGSQEPFLGGHFIANPIPDMCDRYPDSNAMSLQPLCLESLGSHSSTNGSLLMTRSLHQMMSFQDQTGEKQQSAFTRNAEANFIQNGDYERGCYFNLPMQNASAFQKPLSGVEDLTFLQHLNCSDPNISSCYPAAIIPSPISNGLSALNSQQLLSPETGIKEMHANQGTKDFNHINCFETQNQAGCSLMPNPTGSSLGHGCFGNYEESRLALEETMSVPDGHYTKDAQSSLFQQEIAEQPQYLTLKTTSDNAAGEAKSRGKAKPVVGKRMLLKRNNLSMILI